MLVMVCLLVFNNRSKHRLVSKQYKYSISNDHFQLTRYAFGNPKMHLSR